MWFHPVFLLAFVSVASASTFDDSMLDKSQSSRQKRWSFKENCINDTNSCIVEVSKCCEDDSKCQVGSNGLPTCSPIQNGVSTCGALPTVAKCDFGGYDKNTPPAFALTGGQTEVRVQVNLKHIFKDPNNGLYNLDFHLVQYWDDPRLAHKENRLLTFHYNEEIASIWRPDVFVSNSVTAYRQDVAEPARSLRIYQDGLVRLSQRIQANVPCVLTDSSNPYCELVLESYGIINDLMTLVWINPASEAVKTEEPATRNQDARNCSAAYNGRTYPCLKAYYGLQPVISG